MTTLYSCKTETHPDGDCLRITKFDGALNVESSYQIAFDGSWCTCPAGERPSCRHRDMLPRFHARNAINTFWFYDFDRNGWVSMGNAEEPYDRGEAIDPGMDNPGSDPGAEPGVDGTEHIDWDELAEIRLGQRPPKPHSVAVSTGDFDSPSTGSNPVGAAKLNRRGL